MKFHLAGVDLQRNDLQLFVEKLESVGQRSETIYRLRNFGENEKGFKDDGVEYVNGIPIYDFKSSKQSNMSFPIERKSVGIFPRYRDRGGV